MYIGTIPFGDVPMLSRRSHLCTVVTFLLM